MKEKLNLAAAFVDLMTAATAFQPGAIIIDWFDDAIFDDVYRQFIPWSKVGKKTAPGAATGGFLETALGTARFAPVRTLGYSATTPTRSARTPKPIKAIVKNITFGLFDMSVGPMQGTPWGDLQQKDIADEKASAMRLWSEKFYSGSISFDANEFDGIQLLLDSGKVSCAAATSIVKTLNTQIATMINNKDQAVIPTAIYCNAMVQFMIGQELMVKGEKQALPTMTIWVGNSPLEVSALLTPAGKLPLIVDPWNLPISGTPTTYPTYILSEDKVRWEYVPVLNQGGADPTTIDIAPTNAVDRQYTTVMFGAVEMLGPTVHHKRVDVVTRTTVVDPTA